MKKIEKIFEILREIYPDPKTELDYSTPFQLMMAVILSAQTTDKQVNKVTPAIFEYVKTSEDLLDGKRIRDNGKRGIRTKEYVFEEFERAISGVNYYKTKAKNIWKLAEILKKSSPLWLTNPSPKGSPSPLRGLCLYQGTQNQKKQNIEEQLGELMKLPGIGVKSAKVIGHVLWDLPVIAVDTHVHRVVNRWGIMKECVNKSSTTSWSPSFLKEDKMECGKKSEDKTECGKFGMVNGTKTPEETSEILEKIVPLKYKDFAHHAIVLFGRYICTAKKPKCDMCELKKLCEYYKSLSHARGPLSPAKLD